MGGFDTLSHVFIYSTDIIFLVNHETGKFGGCGPVGPTHKKPVCWAMLARSLEGESSLHHALKLHYAGSPDRTETAVDGFVCDAVREDGEIIEVQTGSFGPLKEKARRLCAWGPVRIIHPITLAKTIELYDAEGALIRRRKSPRQGSIWDLFRVLIYAPELPLLPALSIELALIDTVEKRVQDGRGSWRRGKVSINDRLLSAYHGAVPLLNIEDYRRFIPFNGKEEFTVKALGEQARINRTLARKTLYVLTKIGLVQRVRRQRNAWVYRTLPPPSQF